MANNTKAWFKRNKISLFPHPPYSLNLNPIENIQSILKNRLIKRNRKDLGKGTSEESINAFKRAILEEWNNIP